MVNLHNFQEIVKDKKLLVMVGIAIVLVAFLLASFFYFRREQHTEGDYQIPEAPPPEIKVTRVEPLPGSVGVSTSPTIVLYFDKTVTGKKLSLNSDPSVSFDSSLSESGIVLTMNAQKPLANSTIYNLTLLHENKKVVSWSFTTNALQVEGDLIQKIKKQMPVQGTKWSITYITSSDKFYVNFERSADNRYRNEALGWFVSQGLAAPESKLNLVLNELDRFGP